MQSPTDRQSAIEQKVVEALSSSDPRSNEGLVTTAFGDVDGQPINYFVYADVAAELVKAARYRAETATAILMGHFRMSQEGPFIEIVAFRGLEYMYGADPVAPTRVNLEEVADDFGEEGDDVGREPHVVGGFVGRPESEGRLDEETARLHLSLFNLPYQLAWVVDGVSGRFGLYARRPGRPFFNAAFYLVESAGENGGEQELEEVIDDEDDANLILSEERTDDAN